MLLYSLRRILLFIPTLLALSLLAFSLSKCTTVDPVERLISMVKNDNGLSNYLSYRKAYERKAVELGLNKPNFYFSVQPAAYPDTLYLVLNKAQRKNLNKLIAQYGNWPQIENYRHNILELEQKIAKLIGQDRSDAIIEIREGVSTLLYRNEAKVIESGLEKSLGIAQTDSLLSLHLLGDLQELQQSFQKIKEEATPWKMYVPSFRYNGFDNQYHRWFSRFLVGDFGVSFDNKLPVSKKIKPAIIWTIAINGLAIFFAYLISIPIGIYSAIHRGTKRDRWIGIALFALYSLPSFWIATVLQTFITTSEYGMDLFPSLGTASISESDTLFSALGKHFYYLFLPVFCLTYASLAFLSRQMRSSMIRVLQSDYIRTARAKGLSASKVIWKHAFRNALFPLITLFAGVFPAAVAGSVIIELIFNIPGMGKVTLDGINNQDWPVVFTILFLAGILTMIGILVSDLLYKWVDPRVDLD